MSVARAVELAEVGRLRPRCLSLAPIVPPDETKPIVASCAWCGLPISEAIAWRRACGYHDDLDFLLATADGSL